jgi:hypothetical protein
MRTALASAPGNGTPSHGKHNTRPSWSTVDGSHQHPCWCSPTEWRRHDDAYNHSFHLCVMCTMNMTGSNGFKPIATCPKNAHPGGVCSSFLFGSPTVHRACQDSCRQAGVRAVNVSTATQTKLKPLHHSVVLLGQSN